jgi:biotin operon repressor
MKMYKSNRWTAPERQLLKDFYNIKPIEQLAETLQRSTTAITSQVNYLRKRGWTFHRRGIESTSK